jgi:quinoprotein glucose dehydrogenase
MPRSHSGIAVLLTGVVAASLHAQADWPGYGRDKGAQRYSPLAQINTRNVANLIPAWTLSMKRDGLPSVRASPFHWW